VREPGFETLCAHAGEDRQRHFGAASPPIYQTSLFAAPDAAAFARGPSAEQGGYYYTRVSNPTTEMLEAKIAALERAEAARCFGSGMAAVSAAILHSVRAGDHVVSVDTVYGPARALLSNYLERFGVAVTYVDGRDPSDFEAATTPATRLYYLESPSSMLFHQQDLAAVTELARRRGIVTVIDNSWASPYFQNPIDFGVDLVVHSATKYLGGHSDIVAGVVAGSRSAIERIGRDEGGLVGGILDPFAAWLMLRGIRTLPLRMERHQSNALAMARHLAGHPKVARVHYPGLESYPQAALTAKQLRGTSGLLSFELKGGDRAAAHRFLDALKYHAIGVSWGGFESLALPLTPGRGAEFWGARISVGLETIEDLLEDIDRGLAAV
jgi:cystathionine beta-lyase